MSTTEMIEKVKHLRDDFRSLSLTAYYQHKDAFADAHDMASALVDELEAMKQDNTPKPRRARVVVSEEAYDALEVGSIVAPDDSSRIYCKYSPVQWRDTVGVSYMTAELDGEKMIVLRDGMTTR